MWRGLLNIIEKTIKFLYAPIMCLSLATIGLSVYSNVNYKLDYKECSLSYIEYDNSRPDYVTEDYIKREIDNLFSNCKYILQYKDLKYGVAGVSYIMLKLVYIDTNLSLEDYAITLTHELVHINFFTVNERFTTFKTFQILYESGNEYFKNVALAYADSDIKGYMPFEYSCGGYIEDYLKGDGSYE